MEKIIEAMGSERLFSGVKLLILDATYVDMKKQTLLSLNACRGECFGLVDKVASIAGQPIKVMLL